jgi:hypothetical protein
LFKSENSFGRRNLRERPALEQQKKSRESCQTSVKAENDTNYNILHIRRNPGSRQDGEAPAEAGVALDYTQKATNHTKKDGTLRYPGSAGASPTGLLDKNKGLQISAGDCRHTIFSIT